LCPVTLALGLG